MELKDRDGRRKVLTVEVHLPTKVICQARHVEYRAERQAPKLPAPVGRAMAL
jgi:hypothetical protein